MVRSAQVAINAKELRIVLVADLTCRECRNGQYQRCVAGLHDHGGGDTGQDVDEQPLQAGHTVGSQVHMRLEGLEAFLHVMNAEEQEAEAGEHVTDATQCA